MEEVSASQWCSIIRANDTRRPEMITLNNPYFFFSGEVSPGYEMDVSVLLPDLILLH